MLLSGEKRCGKLCFFGAREPPAKTKHRITCRSAGCSGHRLHSWDTPCINTAFLEQLFPSFLSNSERKQGRNFIKRVTNRRSRRSNPLRPKQQQGKGPGPNEPLQQNPNPALNTEQPISHRTEPRSHPLNPPCPPPPATSIFSRAEPGGWGGREGKYPKADPQDAANPGPPSPRAGPCRDKCEAGRSAGRRGRFEAVGDGDPWLGAPGLHLQRRNGTGRRREARTRSGPPRFVCGRHRPEAALQPMEPPASPGRAGGLRGGDGAEPPPRVRRAPGSGDRTGRGGVRKGEEWVWGSKRRSGSFGVVSY